jgi:hypothetical protein
MLRLALAAILAATFCHDVSIAAEILFPKGDQIGPRAELEVSRSATTRKGYAPIEVHLQIGGMQIQQGLDGFRSVKVEGLSTLGQLGAPEVPGTGVLIAVPPGAEPELTILSRREQLVQETSVQPCQPKQRCHLPKEQVAFHFNSKLYDSAETFPEVSARIEEVGKFQGVRLVRLAIYPLQMRMKEKAVLVTTELHAEVRFKNPSRRKVSLSESVARVAREMTANGEDIHLFATTPRSPETMIVITADSLKTSIEPLVEWKRQKGLNVNVYTYTEAGGSRDKVKAFIQSIYDKATPKPSYLLLVGNKTTLPGFKESTGSGQAASDYSYSLLDGKDTVPDILYGRLIADNEAEAKTQVARAIAYEKSANGGWLPKAMTLASEEGFNPSDEDYANEVATALSAGTFTHVDSFFERDSTASHASLFGALKEGRSWISYFGHGTGTDWASTNKFFSNSDVDRIENEGKLPFIVDVACQNGSWVDLSRCFGKAWMTLERSGSPNGAIGYYGGSVNVSWNEPAVMSVGVAKYHFEKPVHSIGASVFAGQMYMYEKMGVANNTTDNLKWYNLFGDPSLLLRTDSPKAYSVAVQAVTGADTQVTARVSDAFGGGFAGVQASVYAPGETGPLAVGTTDASGAISLTLTGKSAIPAGTLLTTTGYNLETYQVPVVPQ